MTQRAEGYRATVVSGTVTYRDGVHTGALAPPEALTGEHIAVGAGPGP